MSSSDIEKLRHYCAYQERCHSEVKEKCRELGIYGDAADEAIAQLVQDNFLNEERYARAYAGGKFRMRQWGKKKISLMLKQKQVSDYCIRKGLSEIDGDEYDRILRQLAEKKYASLKGEQPVKRTWKTLQFLLQRGFEQDLSRGVIEEISKNRE